MCDFRRSPDESHSNISNFGGAVAVVSWVSVFQMWLWLVFWACQIRQKRFGDTIVTRDVLRDFYKSRSQGPEEGRERYCLSVFNCKPFGVPPTFFWTLEFGLWGLDLGASWDDLRLTWGYFGQSCVILGPSWGYLERS